MIKPIDLTSENFENEVLKSDQPALVYFWAPWCGPCKLFSPLIDEIAKEYQDKVKVCKVNIDENLNLPARYGVMSVPSVVLFKDGYEVKKLVGFQPKNVLLKTLGIE
ncbi:MAG: thioredoxin [bacterium]